MVQVFGQAVQVTEMDCEWKADHRKLVMEARMDCLNRGFAPDERFVLCGKCRKVVSLKI
jgi:hypothetical protein